MRFTPICLKTVDDLRKLAPIAANRGTALCLEEKGGELVCVGLMTLQGIIVGPFPTGLLIRVLGPGELWCREFEYWLTLKRGRIRHLRAAQNVPAVKEWLTAVGRQMKKRWVDAKDPSRPGPWADAQFQEMAIERGADLAGFFWSSMLEAAVELRHGGMFVVLDYPEVAPVRLTYEVCSTDPQQEVFSFFQAEMNARGYGVQVQSQLTEQLTRLTSLFSSLACLSSVDGCVVFNRDMALCSFGSEIRVNEHEISNLGRILVEGASGREISESQIILLCLP
jgi:hypothetical protein